MSRSAVTVRIPATTANLGPGFDCLALSLDLWNETTFQLDGDGISVSVQGEGDGFLSGDASNLVARSALDFFRQYGVPEPKGLQILCQNNIPLCSGLGSSGSAVLAGFLGANAFLDCPVENEEILRLAVEKEGHPDNVAAALLGGLVVVISQETGLLTHRFDLPALSAVVVLPEVDLPTKSARSALPKTIPMADAVLNLGRTVLVVEALRSGNLDLLSRAMDDRLHQPYRFPLIPGAAQACMEARRAGAAAAGLSGAGPGLVAFGGDPRAVSAAMTAVFDEARVASRTFFLTSTNNAAEVV